MSMGRREFLLGTLGLAMTGCASNQPYRGTSSDRVDAAWPENLPRTPTPVQRTVQATPEPAYVPRPTPPPEQHETVGMISRSRWAKAAPINARLKPMGQVTRITVHHEGWTPVEFSDEAQTAQRLEAIRLAHIDRMGAGDIGYHLIIDRAGRLWAGRPRAFQGAHVRENNAQNFGVMVLGNFDRQSPTDAQINALRTTLITLQKGYGVHVSNVVTHQELMPTACPGAVLQRQMVSWRNNRQLA